MPLSADELRALAVPYSQRLREILENPSIDHSAHGTPVVMLHTDGTVSVTGRMHAWDAARVADAAADWAEGRARAVLQRDYDLLEQAKADEEY